MPRRCRANTLVKRKIKKIKIKKISCASAMLCYSFCMQANSLITDDFTATIQSDEFAAEYEAWITEQEQNYWREIEAKGN